MVLNGIFNNLPLLENLELSAVFSEIEDVFMDVDMESDKVVEFNLTVFMKKYYLSKYKVINLIKELHARGLITILKYEYPTVSVRMNWGVIVAMRKVLEDRQNEKEVK